LAGFRWIGFWRDFVALVNFQNGWDVDARTEARTLQGDEKQPQIPIRLRSGQAFDCFAPLRTTDIYKVL
jgi:hypothetical protein